MAQVLKLATQLGATNFNNKAVDFGSSGSVTTGTLTVDGGNATLGSTANACAASIPHGSLTLGTSSVSVPLTHNGPTIEPSANYSVVTVAPGSGDTVAAGNCGTIIAVTTSSLSYNIALPGSPVDGQIYTLSFVVTQTSPTITLTGGSTTPSLATPLGTTI